MTSSVKDKPLVYLAGPLFNVAECGFNAALTEQLEAIGYGVFLPQRDGVDRSRPPYDRMPVDQIREAIFRRDRDEVEASDVLLFVLDGRVPDEGACVELGIADTHRRLTGKPRWIVGLKTDSRVAFWQAHLNPMLSVPIDDIFDDEATLLAAFSRRLGG